MPGSLTDSLSMGEVPGSIPGSAPFWPLLLLLLLYLDVWYPFLSKSSVNEEGAELVSEYPRRTRGLGTGWIDIFVRESDAVCNK